MLDKTYKDWLIELKRTSNNLLDKLGNSLLPKFHEDIIS